MKVVWTEHSKIKMRQYGLSKQKLLGILRKPERSEQAIVPGLVAAMKTNKRWKKPDKSLRSKHFDGPVKISPKASLGGKAPGEIWIMYKDFKSGGVAQRKIVSAWRYPGVSKAGEEIPLPEDIRRELLRNNY